MTPQPVFEATGIKPEIRRERLASRYEDSYRVARFINGLGLAVKALGVLLGAVVFLSGASTATSQFHPLFGGIAQGPTVIGLSVIFALIVVLVFWVMGVFVSAQGQVLKASVDSAVHSSPFLSDNDRARIMSLI